MAKQTITFLSLLLLFTLSAGHLCAQAKEKRFPLTQTPSRNSGLFNYTLSVVNEPYADITGGASINNGEVWDDPAYLFEIGFDFDLNGNIINFLEFDGLGAFLRSATADPDVDTYIFPFETDLIDRGYATGISESPISYTVEGDPGSRIMKLEFKNAGSYDEYAENGDPAMYMNFQMWLYEGSNIIEFRFGEYEIPNPDLFFGAGIYCGLADYNFIEDIIINPHFIGGPASAPQLSIADITLEENPENGVVYRLTPIAPIDISVTGQNSTSFCNPNGSATATATGGTEPYTYLWSNGETTATILNLDGGTYFVTVTDAGGSTASGSVTITSPGQLNPNAGATDETAVDANDGTAFAAAFGGTPPYSFEWSNGETTQTITGLAPGEYTVTVTDNVGCTASETVYVNAFECGDLELNATIEHPTCTGLCDGFIFLNPSGGTGAYSYNWSNGTVSQEVQDLCAGFIFVTVTDDAGCVLLAEFELTDPPALVASAIATNETGENFNDGTASVTATGGTGVNYIYQWSNGGTTPLITNLAPGDYTVTVTDENGCSAEATVTVNAFECTFSIQGASNDIRCFNECTGSAGVLVIGGSGNFEYQWSHGDSLQFVENLCAGPYSVTVSEIGTGCELTSTFTIEQQDSLYIVVDDIIHLTDTTTGAIYISVFGGLPGHAVFWEDQDGNFVSFGQDLVDVAPGFYRPVVQDANGCVVSIDPIEILDLTVGTRDVSQIQVKVYPNPANSFVMIDLANLNDYKVFVTAPDGRKYPLAFNSQRASLQHLPSGLYMLEGLSTRDRFAHPLVVMK